MTATTTTTTTDESKKRAAKPLTAIDAIQKIGKLLEQLSLPEQKRVLAFINDTHTASE